MCGVLSAAEKHIYRHIYCINKLMPERFRTFWSVYLGKNVRAVHRAKKSTLVQAVYKPSTLSSWFNLFLRALPKQPTSLLTTSTLWLPSVIFLIFTIFFQFRLSTLNMNTPCLSVARNGVAFERISILTKYHLGFAAKKSVGKWR